MKSESNDTRQRNSNKSKQLNKRQPNALACEPSANGSANGNAKRRPLPEAVQQTLSKLGESNDLKQHQGQSEPVSEAADGPTKRNELPLMMRIRMYGLLFILLYLAVYFRKNDYLLTTSSRIKGNLWPLERLLNYQKFRERYPRIQNLNFKKRLTEDSNRFLIFNQDLISLGRHNMAYIMGKYSYYMRQSPFKSDRTSLEQMDVLNQLDEFNLAQILEASRMQDASGQPVPAPKADSVKFDSPYKDYHLPGTKHGGGAGSSFFDRPVRGHELEKSGGFGRWMNRMVKGKSYFEIPNYPLDQQPDPNRITHIDSDLRDCSSEIKDQGNCGACYAFSWISLVEWHYCKQAGGARMNFSEQHIVDCGHKAKLRGCTEGLLKNAQAFSQVFGLELEQDYPYRAKEGQCRSQPDKAAMKIKVQTSRVVVDRGEWEEILKEQPILTEVHLPSDILSYSRGVHPGLNCNSQMGHGMLVIGYGSEDGVPYWLLKNSMGKNWGENGYLRLSREAPMRECFATGFITKIKFKSLSEDQYNQFYDGIKFEPTIQPEGKLKINEA